MTIVTLSMCGCRLQSLDDEEVTVTSTMTFESQSEVIMSGKYGDGAVSKRRWHARSERNGVAEDDECDIDYDHDAVTKPKSEQ